MRAEPKHDVLEFRMFVPRIKKMNETFKLESNDVPTVLNNERLDAFYSVLSDEVEEIEDIDCDDQNLTHADILVQVADVLADIVVYCFSEARRWGIPLVDVLHIVMDSQDSKLIDGQPLMAEDGSKFIKGPNYIPPEPAIKALLQQRMDNA